MLLREWLKYRYGVFEELKGFPGDKVYTENYNAGQENVTTSGCEVESDNKEILTTDSGEMFCGEGQSLNMMAPTKQNLLCHGQAARTLIFSHSDFTNKNSLDSSLSRDYQPPLVTLLVPDTSHYNLVLDLSHTEQAVWVAARKAVVRFLMTLPRGSSVSMVTEDSVTSPRLLLPPTLVTDNREELASRLPRRVSSLRTSCVKCALKLGLEALKDYKGVIKTGVVILITGKQPETVRLGNVLDVVNEVNIRGFVVSLSDSQIPDDLVKFAKDGQVWGLSDGLVGHQISFFTSEIFMGIINQVEEDGLVKIHSELYHQSEVEATFSVEYGMQGDVFVMLYIDDEMKVEQFELINPHGQKNIFAHFDTGSVYFSVSNVTEVGVWTYRLRLYDTVEFPEDGVAVDVTSGVSSNDAILVISGTNIGSESLTEDSLPGIIFTHLERHGDPIIGCKTSPTSSTLCQASSKELNMSPLKCPLLNVIMSS